MLSITERADGLAFKVRVQPKSARNEIVGLHEDALKVKLTAPPVDGAANKACVAFLAKTLGVSKSSLEIVSGHKDRNKVVALRVPKGEEKAAWAKKLRDLGG
jgi:uncharacterized protein